MNQLVANNLKINQTSVDFIEKIRKWENFCRDFEQADIVTWHIIHGGMYARTIEIPRGVMLTGALVKVPTILSLSGDVSVFNNDEETRITGAAVIPACAGRKQVFFAYDRTWLTMIFRTDCITLESAENEFTDEADNLMSRSESAINHINITGE